ERLSELGIAYPGSPIIDGPGKRYLEDSMRGGKGIQNRYLLMVNSGENPSAKDAAKKFCDSISDVVEMRSSTNPGITLVRPDGYIAYSTAHVHPGETLASLRSILQSQTDQISCNED